MLNFSRILDIEVLLVACLIDSLIGFLCWFFYLFYLFFVGSLIRLLVCRSMVYFFCCLLVGR